MIDGRKDVVLHAVSYAVVFDRCCALLTVGFTVQGIAAKDDRRLYVVTIVAKKLCVQHVVASLVFCVDRGGVEGVYDVHRRKKQTVPPGDGLASEAHNSFFAGIAQPQAIQPVQGRKLVVIADDAGQVEQTAIVFREPARNETEARRQCSQILDAISIQAK